jgi:hypothetical protein
MAALDLADQAPSRHRRYPPTEWWRLIKVATSAWLRDSAPSMGAALSYYTVFSLAPLLLIVVSVAGMVFGEEAARGEVFEQIAGLMGAEPAKAIEGMVNSLSKPNPGAAGTAVGLVALLNRGDHCLWRASRRVGPASGARRSERDPAASGVCCARVFSFPSRTHPSL